jgi:hypothetical protein
MITIDERPQRKGEKMPTLVSCLIGVGFIALATILVIHVVRDIKSPTEGKRIHEAFVHLEKTLQDQVIKKSTAPTTNRIVLRENPRRLG